MAEQWIDDLHEAACMSDSKLIIAIAEGVQHILFSMSDIHQDAKALGLGNNIGAFIKHSEESLRNLKDWKKANG